MTELSFLIDLLLNHKLPKATRDLVAARIKEVEGASTNPIIRAYRDSPPPPPQAASTLAAMARHGDLIPAEPMPPIPAAVPVTHIAQTPAAVAALNSRQQAINSALSGKIEKGATSPRKF